MSKVFDGFRSRSDILKEQEATPVSGPESRLRIAGILAHAEWRHTQPLNDKGEMQIGFDTPIGIVRLVLSEESARNLGESVMGYVRSHSLKSSGIPSDPKSVPDGGEKV